MDIIPTTLVSAFVEGNILQVLFVAILFGIGMIMVGDRAKPVLSVMESRQLRDLPLVDILMKAAPIGAFGAFAFTIGKYGIGSVVNLAALVGTFYLTSALFVIVILGTVCMVNGFSIFRLISLSQGRDPAGAGHLVVGIGAALADGEDGEGRLRPSRRGPGRADRLSASTWTAPTST